MSTDAQYTDLREYLAVVRARKVQIALVTLLVVVAAVVFSFRQTPVYQGVAKVLVRPTLTSASQLANPLPPNLETERQLVLSPSVAAQVKKNVSSKLSLTDLLKRVTVDVITDTEVLVIRFDDPSPDLAARYANGFAFAYRDFRTQQALSQIVATSNGVSKKLGAVNDQIANLNRSIDSA